MLDALDECNESGFQDLVRMLKIHFRKETNSSGNMKYFLTSRPYEQITSEFQELVNAFSHVRIPEKEESECISREVNYMIRYRVQQLVGEKKLTEGVRSHLEQRLFKIPYRTYLWAHLVFDDLKQVFKKTEKGIDSVIDTLPESVNQAYDKILNRSKEQHKVQKILLIILAATRPLTLKEMNVAVNVQFSPRFTSAADLDLEDEECFKNTIRNWCGLFISIYTNKVYLLHQTAREFLVPSLSSSGSPSPQSLNWYNSINIQQAHLLLAEICMIYLEFRDFENRVLFDENEQTHISDYALFEYSARYWAAHLRHARIEDQEHSTFSVLRLCDPNSKRYTTWFGTYWKTNHYGKTLELTALMVVSYFGFQRAAKLLLEKGAEANIQDEDGWTALYWAAGSGHGAVVETLLEKGADVNIQNKDGWTALHWAAKNGHGAVVEILQNH